MKAERDKKNMYAWWTCGIGALMLLVCIGIFLLHKYVPRRSAWNNAPRLLQVYYYRYPNQIHHSELIAMERLDRLDTAQIAETLLSHNAAPMFHTISANNEDLPFAYNVINISTPDKPNHYRVNIVENLVKRTIADVEYKNEPFLILARGDNWYLAITKRLEE